jgi:TonB-linked SusC/RagA family outer membrane protein
MKKFLSFVVSILLVGVVSAQTRVTGRVISSDDGAPMPYVNIQIKGQQGKGSFTDNNGKYVVEKVPANAVLVFSFIGFITQEVPVGNKTVIDVSLQPDAVNLGEVMVVAYGTSTKNTFTGAASVVKSDAIKDVPVVSFENALNGKIAGVQITTVSGQAGSTSSIRVRGIGSMNASNDPLYVIDGVPVQSGSAGNLSSYLYTSNNIMSTINPSDIESVTVLKDAAASALYGSRAANGVIVITTKKGKMGKAQVSFKASVGLSPEFASKNFEVASPWEQIQMYYENFWNANVYAYGKTEAQASAAALTQLNNRFNKHGYIFAASDNTINSLTVTGSRAGTYYDWSKDLFRTAVYQTYDVSVSGATEASSYYSSISYTDEQGRSVINDFNRITGRLNLNNKVGKYVEFATGLNLAKSNKSGFNDTRSTGSNYFFQQRNLLWPLYWPTDYQTGALWTARYGSYAYNPVYYNKEWENSSRTLRISANESMSVKFMPELIFKTILSYDNSQTSDHLYYSALHFNGTNDKGSVTEMRTNVEKVVSSSTLSYNKVFAKKHTMSLLVGWEGEANRTDFVRAKGTNLPNSSLHSVSTAGVLDAYANESKNNMLSLLSKGEYNYDNKYYGSISFRRDGSSRLGPDTRWGNFWSVAGSWRIDKEDFMKSIEVISSLRLRASYGVNGTLPSDLYGWRSLTSYANKYMTLPGGGVSSISDPNLTWETNYTTNIAIEFGLLKQRITGTIEFFNRDSKNLLQDVPVSMVTGMFSTLKNVGEINNKGLEFELTGEIYKGKDLTWNAGVTGSVVNSKVTKLYGGQDIIWYDPTGGDARAKFIYREGESTLALYGLEWAGVEKTTGKNVWYLNNDKTPSTTVNGRPATYTYSEASEKIIGNINPKLFGGINTDVTCKGISLALNFNYKIGGYTYDGAGKDVNDDGYYWERIMDKDAYDNRWTPEHTDAKYPMRMATDMEDVNQRSSRHMHKADFLRLKNLTLGYVIPKNITEKVNVSRARIYFNGLNLWTMAAYDVYDPEVNEYGSRGWEMPLGKTYTFGIELTF